MSDEVLVKVEGVSKKFCRSLKRSMWYGVQDVTGELLGRTGDHDRLRKNEFWAVDDVSFELKRGECLGLIGPNGAGKSTLLKMLNGLVKPDRGRITMRGRVGALIELGAGFNPILTARENIYVNGSVLGFTKKEIDRKFDAIVDFAEIEEFIDTPVQSFSSGMKVRLGFAVAAQMEPDVLVIDEVLAVGDEGFRSKCYTRISSLKESAAVIFVSHIMAHIARMSNPTLLINRGAVDYFGSTPEAILRYQKRCDLQTETRFGSGECSIRELRINGNPRYTRCQYGQPTQLILELNVVEAVGAAVLDVVFRDVSEGLVAECSNFVEGRLLRLDKKGTYQVLIQIPELLLNPGRYNISVFLLSHDMTRHYDWWQRCYSLEVSGGRPAIAGVQFRGEWTISQL